jgi:hypothetical protein
MKLLLLLFYFPVSPLLNLLLEDTPSSFFSPDGLVVYKHPKPEGSAIPLNGKANNSPQIIM